ncbi:MAG: tandem-95 repeat protein, partial [Chloroflexi bacterium]|nr:tandem-95 repeat protein [Chloroflexota bacterium]
MTDVWFTVDATRTKALTDIPIPTEIESLPDAHGYGWVRTLHESMALDSSGQLKDLVEQFANETDPAERNELLPQLMYQWAGGKNAHMDDGYFADAWFSQIGNYFYTTITQEQYSVLEAFTGQEKYFNNTASGLFLLDRYNQLCDIVFYQLMAETHLQDLYQQIQFDYDEASQTWRGEYSAAIDSIVEQAAIEPEHAKERLSDFLRSVRGMNPYVSENTDAARVTLETIIRDNWQDAGIQQLTTVVSEFYLGTGDQAETFNATQQSEQYTGVVSSGDGDDTLYGVSGVAEDEVLSGDAGDDVIRGYEGDDVLIGGTGNDTLRGGEGDDSYYFALGDGQDTIELTTNTAGIDTLVLGEGISAADISLEKIFDDLIIKVGNSDDQIKVTGWFGSTLVDKQLDQLSFANGATMSMDELLASKPVTTQGTDGNDSYTLLRGYEGWDEIHGQAGDDALQGMAGDDTLKGGAGNDTLQGFEGNDTLVGGTGNDTLRGMEGDDRFLFNLGDGADSLILDDAAGFDTVAFGAGIALTDLELQKDFDDLLIHVGSGGDQLRLVGWFNDNYADKKIDQFSFADDSVLSRDELLAQKQILVDGTKINGNLIGHEGTDLIVSDAQDDNLIGQAGDDVLIGGAGDDILNGGDGDDVFRFNLGDGQDRINLDDADGLDTLEFGLGIATNDIQFYKDGSYDLIIRVGDGGDHVRISHWYNSGYAGKRVDQFSFNDGTVWDSATLETMSATPRTDVTPLVSATVTLGNIVEGGSRQITAAELLANASDADGDTLNITKLSVDFGTLIDNGDGSWTYTPDTDNNGIARFTYQVTDGMLNFTATADLTVTPENDAPDSTGEVLLGTSAEDASRLITATELLATMSDVDGDTLTITALTVDNGELEDHNDGSWTYTPGAQFNGLVRFTCQVSDGTESLTQTARLAVGEDRNDLLGTNGIEYLNGTEAADYLNAQAGNDTLRGKVGDDILIGGAGDDNLYGGAGNDLFRFNLGDGQDTLYLDDVDGVDTLQFGVGITLDDLTLSKEYPYNLLIDVGNGGDRVRVQDWFYAASNCNLDFIAFADGTTLSREELLAQKMVAVTGDDSNDSLTGGDSRDIIEGMAGDDYLTGNAKDDHLNGGTGNDMLSGNDGNDELLGGSGDDSLMGHDGNDVITGGTGNDTLAGGAGDDTFHFNLGDGQDSILLDDVDGFDTLAFGAGITETDLTLEAQGVDLLLKVGAGGEQIRLVGWMSQSNWDERIDRFLFADGAELSADELVAQHPVLVFGTDGHDNIGGHDGADRILGNDGYDYISAQGGDDLLDGGAGNDQLHANDGNDTLIGGAGYDHLYGGAGDDTFLFNRGDSYDVICLDDAEGNDKLVFGEGIEISDLLLVKKHIDLEIRIAGTDDKVIVENWFHPNYYDSRLDGFKFTNGTELSYDELIQQCPVHILGGDGPDNLAGHEGDDIIDGGKGDDYLSGNVGDDLLIGGEGNDWLSGGVGDDTYLFNAGDGQDNLIQNEATGIDTLKFGNGITLDDIALHKDGDNLLVKVGSGSDHVSLDDWFRAGTADMHLDQFAFADGSILTSDELLEQKQILSVGSTANESLLGHAGEDVMFGGAGNDNLSGYAGDDVLDGGAGDDYIQGDAGNDDISGGTGNDDLHGGSGDDIFRFNLGDGQDTILLGSSGDSDTLIFGVGIALADLQLQKVGSCDLVLKVGNAGDQVTVPNWFHPNYIDRHLAKVIFADGTTLTHDELLAQKPIYGIGSAEKDSLSGHEGTDVLQGAAGNDNLSGYAGDDVLDGGAGDDYIQGDAGNDDISGGTGNDDLHGGSGDDIFRFNLGDGEDTIQAGNSGDSDTLAFGAGIVLDDLQLQKVDVYDLLIKVGETGDQVTLSSWYHPNYADRRMAQVTFADGSTLTSDELLAQKPVYSIGGVGNDNMSGTDGMDNLIGAEGDDYLYGKGGDDVLTGGTGSDYLRGDAGNDDLTGGSGNDDLGGGSGNDTFRFNLGDGQDTILADDADGTETLAFGAGITSADLTFTESGDNLIVSVGAGGDQVTLLNWFKAGETLKRIDLFTFDDGQIATAADLMPREMANLAPQVTSSIDLGSMVEDGSMTITAEQLLANATDVDGDSLQIEALTVNRGTLTAAGPGLWTYTPTGNDNGTVTFSYQISDGLEAATTTAGLAITPVNDAPTVTGPITLGGMVAGETLTLLATDLLGNATDVDGDTLNIATLTADNGTLTDNQDGTWAYTAAADYNGTVNFSYTVSDSELTVAATANLIVNAGLNVVSGTGSNDSLQGTADPDQIVGQAGNDYLYGQAGNDILEGGDGTDTLYGQNDNDELHGGAGNDNLSGGSGDDTFHFNIGDGQDTINVDDASGNDTLAFGTGIGLNDLQLQKSGNDLLVKVGNSGDQIKLSLWYHPSYASYRLDQFSFADGTILTCNELLAQLPVHGT